MGTLVRIAPGTDLGTCLQLERDPSSVQQGRRWLRDTLSEVDHSLNATRVDDATLVLSELLTNACLHAREADRCAVLLACSTSQILLGVADTDPSRLPRWRTYEDYATAETGRGLYLLRQLADQWGCTIDRTQRWKIVWAAFRQLSAAADEASPAREF